MLGRVSSHRYRKFNSHHQWNQYRHNGQRQWSSSSTGRASSGGRRSSTFRAPGSNLFAKAAGALIAGGVALVGFNLLQSLWESTNPLIAFADDGKADEDEASNATANGSTEEKAKLSESVSGAKKKEEPDSRSEFEKQLASLPKFDHVIVGGGVAAYEAAKAIQTAAPDATILMVAGEELPPYHRGPLTKELWSEIHDGLAKQLQYFDDKTEKSQSIIFDPEHPEGNGSNYVILRNFRAIDFSPSRKYVELEDGQMVKFDKLLIATGSSPKELDIPVDPAAVNRVTTFRTARDFFNLYARQSHIEHITILGGDVHGTELASALTSWRDPRPHVSVTQITDEPGLLSKLVPDYLSQFLTKKLCSTGVDVKTNTTAKSVKTKEGRLSVELSDGSSLDTDHIVVALGTTPNSQLASRAFLEVDQVHGGIVVNQELSAHSDVYVAGDVASWWDPVLLTRRRAEEHDHAKQSGRLAGMNMAGARRPYYYVPYFNGMVADAAFQTVGIVDSNLETVGVWQSGLEEPNELIRKALDTGKFPTKEELARTNRVFTEEYKQNEDYERGVVYYLNNDKKVVGLLLWNMFDHLDAAQAIIERWRQFDQPTALVRQLSLDALHVEEPLSKSDDD